MNFLFLFTGILIVGIAYSKSKRAGSALLAIVVLSLLITSRTKGIIK